MYPGPARHAGLGGPGWHLLYPAHTLGRVGWPFRCAYPGGRAAGCTGQGGLGWHLLCNGWRACAVLEWGVGVSLQQCCSGRAGGVITPSPCLPLVMPSSGFPSTIWPPFTSMLKLALLPGGVAGLRGSARTLWPMGGRHAAHAVPLPQDRPRPRWQQAAGAAGRAGGGSRAGRCRPPLGLFEAAAVRGSLFCSWLLHWLLC